MRDHSNSRRGFTRRSQAWYFSANPFPDDVAEEVMFGLYEASGGGTTGEMAMRWRYITGGEPWPRLECFGASWSALWSFSDLLKRLGELDIEAPDMFGEFGCRIVPDEFCDLLIECGFEDQTERVNPDEAAKTERALAINAAICNAQFDAMGLTQADAGIDLSTLTLHEMLDAVAMVEKLNKVREPDGSMTIHVVPAERLVAAVYTLTHYQPGGTIAIIGDTAVGVGRIKRGQVNG